MLIKIKKVSESAKLPTRGTEHSAGYDLYANSNATIWHGETSVINTGIAMEIPEGYFGAIYARSGLATKHGIRPANCVAVIDSDYRGEIKVPLYNDGPNYTINNGERIAQIVIQPYLDIEWVCTEELSETNRSNGGFGSTGK